MGGRLCRPDLLRAVNSFATRVATWAPKHDLMLYRLMGYLTSIRAELKDNTNRNVLGQCKNELRTDTHDIMLSTEPEGIFHQPPNECSAQRKVASIRIFNHHLYTFKQQQITLTSFYDKMQMFDNIRCIPYGSSPSSVLPEEQPE